MYCFGSPERVRSSRLIIQNLHPQTTATELRQAVVRLLQNDASKVLRAVVHIFPKNTLSRQYGVVQCASVDDSLFAWQAWKRQNPSDREYPLQQGVEVVRDVCLGERTPEFYFVQAAGGACSFTFTE